MKLKYRNLPSISKEEFVSVLSELKVIRRICEELDIDRAQYMNFLEMYDINPFDHYTEEELKEATKRGKIKARIDSLELTKETVLEDIKRERSINRLCDMYDIKGKSALYNIFDYFEIDFDKLVPKNTRLEIAKEHRRNTNLERFGYENAMFDPEKVEKIKQAWEDKTDEEIAEIVSARQETNLERYGVTHNWQSEKTKQTIRDKYGVEYASQNEEVRKRIGDVKRTKIEEYISKEQLEDAIVTYKTENGAMRELNIHRYQLRWLLDYYDLKHEDLASNEERKAEHQRLVIATNYERYDQKYNISAPEVRDKMKETWLKNLGYDNPFGSPEIRDRINQTKVQNGSVSSSKAEVEIVDFIRMFYQGEILTNVWKIIPNNELDIYIPEYKLAIEHNGAYWHNTERKPKDYHFKKSKDCDDLGIRLIHIFEGDWLDEVKRNIYKQLIANALGANMIKLSAGKTELRKLEARDVRKFFDENHLGGYASAKVAYGLFYNDELIHAELFGKARFRQDVEWESIRGTSKLGYMIYGGYEKVLKAFKEEYNPQSIVSYVDFNTFAGRLHEHAGFKFDRYTGPDHWYLDSDGKLKRWWIVRGNDPKDKEWERQRQENLKYEYYFSGSKTYIWRKQ